MYENIRKAIAEHEAKTLAQFAQSLENKTAAELLNSWQFRDRMTPATLQAMKNTDPDTIPAAELLEKINKREQERKPRTRRNASKLSPSLSPASCRNRSAFRLSLLAPAHGGASHTLPSRQNSGAPSERRAAAAMIRNRRRLPPL